MPTRQPTSDTLDILVLGAVYGLLPAALLALAQHRVTVVCREAEQHDLATHGVSVQTKTGAALSARTARGPSSQAGTIGLSGPDIATGRFDIAFLAMSEPQYVQAGIAELMQALARSRTPIVALMNLPPSPYLARATRLDTRAVQPAYAAWKLWAAFDPDRVTAASPDAQVARTLARRADHITVTLASNLKVAPFPGRTEQTLMEAIDRGTAGLCGPVSSALPRIVAHPSPTIALAKWPMLMTGNSRCLPEDGGLISISAAVRNDMDQSKRIYAQTEKIIRAAGATESDVVPFPVYARVARQLTRPSSLARALAGGAVAVERADLMIVLAGRTLGIDVSELQAICTRIETRLGDNASQHA